MLRAPLRLLDTARLRETLRRVGREIREDSMVVACFFDEEVMYRTVVFSTIYSHSVWKGTERNGSCCYDIKIKSGFYEYKYVLY